MKKVLTIMLALSLIFSFSGCFARTEKAVLDCEEKITKNWLEYLAVNEAKYFAIIWGAEYINEFCKAPDITSYRRALAATEAVAATLCKLEIPEFTVTQQDINSAMQQGMDVSFLDIEFAALEADIAADITLWENIFRDVMTDGFWSYGTEYLEKQAQFQLDEAKNNIQYLCYTTNYLMLLLNKSSYFGNISERFPTLFKPDELFIDSFEDVEVKVSDCLDELESLISEQAEIAGIQTANSIVFEDAISSGDYSEVYSYALDWGSKASTVPLPQWDALPTVYSYRRDGQMENMAWTSVGEDLSEVPNGLILEYEGLSTAQVSEYVDSLLGMGFEFTSSEESSDGVSGITHTDGTNGFTVQWEEGITTLCIDRENICFCPRWYSDYLTAK